MDILYTTYLTFLTHETIIGLRFCICLLVLMYSVWLALRIRIFDLSTDLEGEVEEVLTVDEETRLDQMEWTHDGQILAASSARGVIHAFLAKLPLLGSSCGHRMAFLSSLQEVSVHTLDFASITSFGPRKDDVMSQSDCMVIAVETEPSVISVGPSHVATAMNNKAWFYCLTGENRRFLLRTIEYVGIIKDLRMNDHYVAVLFTDGRINLHHLESSSSPEDDEDSPGLEFKQLQPESNESRVIGRRHYLPDSEEETDDTDDRDAMNMTSVGYHRESKMIEDQKGKISCLQMTTDLLVYASESGNIEFFCFEDWAVVNLYRHAVGIKLIETDFQGLRVSAVDVHGKIFIYNAVTDAVMDVSLDDFPVYPSGILWDKTSLDSNLFILHDNMGSIHVHVFVRETIRGPCIEFVESCSIPSSQVPRLLLDGLLSCQTTSGKRVDILLPTHSTHPDIDHPSSTRKTKNKEPDNSQLLLKKLHLSLKMRRYSHAMNLCSLISSGLESSRESYSESVWSLVGKSALFDVNLDVAEAAFANVPDYGMLYSIKSLKGIEEKALLSGHLALCLQNFDLAQELFLSSSQPQEALTMRQNIQDWEIALTLAKRLSPEVIPIISREHALQLELSSDHEGALIHFEKALINRKMDIIDTRPSSSFSRNYQIEEKDFLNDEQREHQLPYQVFLEKAFEGSTSKLDRHEELCIAGIARNAIRTGNTHRGLAFASRLKHDKELQIECARILESLKLYLDAAGLFELGGDIDKACSLYLQVKNVSKVSPYIDSLTSRDILVQYAKLQEEEHRFKEAITAFKKAGQDLEVVRILLEKVKNPGEAIRIVRENKCTEGAKMVAKFFQSINDICSAIEFLILSKCTEEAFQLASSTNQMDVFSNVLLSTTSSFTADDEQTTDDSTSSSLAISDFHSVALFYEQDKNLLMAGKFYCLSQNYVKGVKLLLNSVSQSPSTESEAIQLAIEAASKCKEDKIIRKLVDFLVGDVDGTPRDFKYLFRLYMKLGHVKDAAKTAIVIAREEQSAGNYRNAHSLLFSMSQELRKHQIRVLSDMNSSLMLIHSYLLAKVSGLLSSLEIHDCILWHAFSLEISFFLVVSN